MIIYNKRKNLVPLPPEPPVVEIIQLPSLVQRAGNLAKAVPGIIANPRMAPREVMQGRLDTCRDKCPGNHWVPSGNLGTGACAICGCCSIKHWLAGQACPIGAWGPYKWPQ